MSGQENVEELMRKLHEIMKKQGCQAQQFKVGNQVIKISLQSQTHILTDSSTSLDRTVRQNSDTKPPKKKISLNSAGSSETSEAPNACFRNFFQEDDVDREEKEVEDEGDQGEGLGELPRPEESAWIGEVNEHINFLLSNHPESKDHIQAVLSKLEEVESENKERRKVEQEISNMLSSSLSTSHNLFESESTLLSLSRLSDPLCRLVSAHLKTLASGSLKCSNQNPTFLFLYSQPLVTTARDGSTLPLLSQIDYEREEENIKKVLNDCKVGYTKECATVERVGTWLQSGIEVIHFCGHGIKGERQNQGDFLVFEDKDARAEFVDQESLCQILKRLKKPLQFVFVASCYSRMLGEVFLRAGVPHVICVRREERILDEACQEFVRLFYLSCLNNGMTICESFDFAKLQVSLMGFPKGEEHKFVLLTKPISGLSQHNCSTLNNPLNGQFKDLTLKPIYSRNIPSKVQNFIVRHQIMSEVISALGRHRFITIKGIPGIGKSTLARQLARYLNFRGKFRDGILYTQLAGCQTVDGLFQSLSYQIFEGVCSDKRSFDDSLDSIAKQLHGKHVLLVIDNCDSLLVSNDRTRFKQIIESLLRRCHQVHLLFANRTRVGDLLHTCELEYCTERVFNLEKLGPEDAKTLFLTKAPRSIHTDQEDQFLRMERGVTDLKSHPLFQFLNGHPQAISLSAALLSQKSLKQVYQMLMQQSLADQFALKHDDNRGYNAFRVSLQVSWNIINHREPNAALMFRVMGMIPAGLDNQLMPRVFGARWRQAVKVLNKYSLLKKTERLGATYYSIHPFTISYAESLLENEEKRRFHEKITEELQRRVFEKVYKNIGTLSSSAQKAAELYLVEEINYKSCIYREYSFLGDDSKIKSFYKTLFSRPEDSSQDQGLEYKTDTTSQKSSTSSTSKFIQHRKIQNQSSDDDAKPIDEKGRRLASKQKSPRGEPEAASFKAKKKDPPAILRLMLYQATVLFVIKNFSACQRIVKWGLQLSSKHKSPLSQANFYRILACLSLIRKQQSRAKDLFSKALELFAMVGCGLGTASCESAIGYIRYLEEEYAPAKKSLESALKYYEQLPHLFGKHYLNRWLYSIKSKINREKKQLVTHNQQAKKLIKQAKAALKGNKIDNFLLKHKVGCFVFRFMFDNISLFLQCSFEVDVKPKRIPLSSTKDQSILKNLVVGAHKKPVLDTELLPISEDQQKSMQQIIDDLDIEAEWQQGDLAEFYKDSEDDPKDIDFNEEEFEKIELNLLKTSRNKKNYTQETEMELGRIEKLKGSKNAAKPMMREVPKPSSEMKATPIHGKSKESSIALEKKKADKPLTPFDKQTPRSRIGSISFSTSTVFTPKPTPKKN